MIKDEEYIISYDLRSAPDGITLEHVIEIFENTGVIIYDSFHKGNKPTVIKKGKKKIIIKDTEGGPYVKT